MRKLALQESRKLAYNERAVAVQIENGGKTMIKKVALGALLFLAFMLLTPGASRTGLTGNVLLAQCSGVFCSHDIGMWIDGFAVSTPLEPDWFDGVYGGMEFCNPEEVQSVIYSLCYNSPCNSAACIASGIKPTNGTANISEGWRSRVLTVSNMTKADNQRIMGLRTRDEVLKTHLTLEQFEKRVKKSLGGKHKYEIITGEEYNHRMDVAKDRITTAFVPKHRLPIARNGVLSGLL